MFFNFLLRRLLYVIPMLLITTFVVFAFILMIPGDPAVVILGQSATPEAIVQLRQQMGLDRPVFVQFIDWLSKAIQGDLGRSVLSGQPVLGEISARFAVSFQLVVLVLVFSIIMGMFFAITSVFFPNSIIDYIARFLGTLGTAIPNFWLASMIVLLFSLQLNWLPATGFTSITESVSGFLLGAILPMIALAGSGIAQITRHLRSSLMETMGSDYLRTAYSKGVNRWQAIFNHGLRNAMLPVVTTIGILFGNALGATVIIETIFAIPGMGQLAINSIMQRDFTMLQGVVLVMIAMVIIINLITDVVYAILDPRIEY